MTLRPTRARGSLILPLLLLAVAGRTHAAPPVEARKPFTGDIREAVGESLRLVEASSAEYRRQRQCFSCHHQALSVLALVEARDHGFPIDEANLAAQLDHTAAHLDRGRDGYAEGRGQGGGVDTAGWALWALEAGGRQPTETTAAVANYLLSNQSDLPHWRAAGKGRPPTQGSDFTATYIALRGLQSFAAESQAAAASTRRTQALEWLAATSPQDTEDAVFRLRSLSYAGADESLTDTAATDLLALQHPDGGWSQTPDAPSDPYATATALVALHETGRLTADAPPYRRGVDFLLRTRLPDGSWHVPTRAKPIQIYFESGFPHAKDQFISIAATCWSLLALLPACPDSHSP